ncbi:MULTISPECIES: TetR family transcriptional regulator [Clavibacter]|uniref:TetR family transcriptional regulator n=2 Tax=Clavibacter TaxID=1573 RepID=A0A399NV92_9MICO|nr:MULTISPECIES: TetR family transcriptional regulator [Clavibacter]KDP92571.1 TetR family transcriptional regulator [Clavibacter cf. michiganensis LMG 26808]RII98110.1 TetR family transcriptional regulator [Clavibacter michiganensis]UKF25253.1 TetR/AcrR family transcriptional regulator; helix-turn-helix transcriptional regulator [Clavibacter sp. A6099]
MSRWQPDARERLAAAALELFRERGFAETTVPEITARAGLTTRTFFRHFADKREVLFAEEDELPALVTRIIREAAPDRSPLQVVEDGFPEVVASQFAEGRDTLLARKRIIGADAGLQEREMRKVQAMQEAVRAGFVERGSDPLTAMLVAHATATVFGVSIGRWLSDEGGTTDLAEVLHETLDAFRRVMGAGA